MLLQRSRAGSVARLYEEFFKCWPNPEDICDADVSDIEALISPLGLSGRANRIKTMAIAWSERKTLPHTAQELQELPGIGPYSANATAIAMSWDADPCVDSVSERVFRRFLGGRDNTEPKEQVARRVYSQIPKRQWRELNWAILDLAATLCMPRVPRCSVCPLSDECGWAKRR
jgi:A/G-specific adenine glycosylase